MTPRMTFHFKRIDSAFNGLVAFETELRAGPLDHIRLHMIKLRASQINGCAVCIRMHAADALKDGETHLHLHMLAAWQDSVLFTARERPALAWAEALTTVAAGRLSDADWEAVSAAFNADELAFLTFAICGINPVEPDADCLWGGPRAGPARRTLLRTDPVQIFQTQRPRLLRLAYRMPGNHAKAEDMVQDAWFRWQNGDHGRIAEPAAWLPEPLVEDADDALRPDNLTLSLMAAARRIRCWT